MATVVTAISMSHAPGALGWPDAPSPIVRQSMAAAARQLAERLEQKRPDVIIAFLDDHFENHFRNLMPSLAIGIAPWHSGPSDHLLEFLRFDRRETIPSSPELAEELLRSLIQSGFDVARMGTVEYGNNLMVPLKLIRPQLDIPIIPVFINVFSPPLISVSRAYAFGEAVRSAIDASHRELRVAFLGTGGLSHWPPVWIDTSPEDDAFLQRMKRFQSQGREVLKDDPNLWVDLGKYEIEMARKNQYPLNSTHPLINADWDREFLQALERGDTDHMRALSFEEVQGKAGHGGLEILTWVAVMGAMHGMPAKIIAYEPVLEWICGMGFAAYDC
jgi:2,3-dihydroxyphenylpropionate 1,2-dioxygenase